MLHRLVTDLCYKTKIKNCVLKIQGAKSRTTVPILCWFVLILISFYVDFKYDNIKILMSIILDRKIGRSLAPS